MRPWTAVIPVSALAALVLVVSLPAAPLHAATMSRAAAAQGEKDYLSQEEADKIRQLVIGCEPMEMQWYRPGAIRSLV